jgi:uncharacterized protein
MSVPTSPGMNVTDTAGFLSKPTFRKLGRTLLKFKTRTKHQVWVYITDQELEPGQTIEDFGRDAFNAWGIGRKRQDDGAVLFVFWYGDPDTFRMRIQVGYGLAKKLPDAECVRILREVVAPPIKAGQHDEGITAGVAAILAAIEPK